MSVGSKEAKNSKVTAQLNSLRKRRRMIFFHEVFKKVASLFKFVIFACFLSILGLEIALFALEKDSLIENFITQIYPPIQELKGNKLIASVTFDSLIIQEDGKIKIKDTYFAIKNNILAVKKIHITKHPRNKVTILIQEREPLFFLYNANSVFEVIDTEGVIFPAIDGYKMLEMPVVNYLNRTHVNSKDLLNIRQGLNDNVFFRSKLVSINNFYNLFWIFSLEGKINVYVDVKQTDFSKIFERVAYIFDNICPEQDCPIKDIDFRVDNKILINFTKPYKS